MLEQLNLPTPLAHLYRNRNNSEEVALLYDSTFMFDSRPDAEYMLDAVVYLDEEDNLVTYPKHIWEEEFEIVPVSIKLFDEE